MFTEVERLKIFYQAEKAGFTWSRKKEVTQTDVNKKFK